MPRSTSDYRRNATTREVRVCTMGAFEISEFLTPTDFNDLFYPVRSRVIGVFRHAQQTVRVRHITREQRDEDRASLYERPPRTRAVDADNYITGVAPKLSELARYIRQELRNHFIRRGTLRDIESLNWALEISDTLTVKFMAQLEEKLILVMLELMLEEGEIWFDQHHGGLWQIKQSVVDEHLQRRQAARDAIAFNQRPEHGRVRSQRKRSETPSGTSTGETKRSLAIGRHSR